MAYGALTCLGRHTLTGMLTASGQQFRDWSGAYRIFCQQRLDKNELFAVARKEVLKHLEAEQMIIAHMDDTIIRKSGRKVAGTSWRRDPLGPPFHINFIWGQRYLQISMALPQGQGACQSRAIPVDFHHCPTAKKPGKTSGADQWKAYREKQKQMKLSVQGIDRIKLLRRELDQDGYADKELFLGVDGSYTNRNVLKCLPERTTLIGRIRKDTKLYELPEAYRGKGRKRVYGAEIPAPEQIRQSDEYRWKKVKAWAAGKVHQFSVKVVKGLRWRAAGEKHILQLVVIRPLGYRLSKKSPILYRKPAYLLCTDPDLDIKELLQAYLWRWEIEVNFRDEKTLIGAGEAQVRNSNSVEILPAFLTAIYAFILLAAHKVVSVDNKWMLPRPRWYRKKKNHRLSTGEIINLLRTELWAKSIGFNFSGFVKKQFQLKSLRNTANPFESALFYVRK